LGTKCALKFLLDCGNAENSLPEFRARRARECPSGNSSTLSRGTILTKKSCPWAGLFGFQRFLRKFLS
jgi:hypothetical protein